MKRRLTHIALCIAIVAATPIYLIGMVLLFCLAATFHGARGLLRKAVGRRHSARLVKLKRLGK